MTFHRLSQNVLAKQAYAGAIANATTDGTAIDTLGYRRVTFICHLKTGAATTVQIGLQESSDNSSFATVNFLGTSNAALQPATAQAASLEGIYFIDVDLQGPRKRYIRPEVIGTGTAGDVEVIALLYGAQLAAPAQDFPAILV